MKNTREVIIGSKDNILRRFVATDGQLLNPGQEALETKQPCLNYVGLTEAGFCGYTLRFAKKSAPKAAEAQFMAPHFVQTLSFSDPNRALKIDWRFRFFPETPGYECSLAVFPQTVPSGSWLAPEREDRMDLIPFPLAGAKVTSACFFPNTDKHNEFVEISAQTLAPGQGQTFVDGNVLRVETPDGRGLWVYKIAASPKDRRDQIKASFCLENDAIGVYGWGITPQDFVYHKKLRSSPWVVIPYAGGDYEAMAALRSFFSRYWQIAYSAPASIMVNPWGGGGKVLYENMNDAWLEKEFKAAAEVGATHYQIDDGWQNGGYLRDICVYGKKVEPEYWEINPKKFPEKFRRAAASAKAAGIRLGLWFCPNINDEYRSWKRDADLLISMTEEYAIEYVKIDGVEHRSYAGEENFNRLLETVHTQSSTHPLFNLDVTAGVRKGFLFSPQFGPMFIANRYPHAPREAPNKYRPQNTLRNFWKMARFIPPHLVQVEVPNIEFTPENFPEPEKSSYAGDPHDPKNYGGTYCAMLSLFGAPLLWLQPSHTPAELMEEYRKVMALYSRHTAAIREGVVFPIGAEPSGKSICGFISMREDGGTILIFRELSENAEAAIRLPKPISATVEALKATAEVSASIKGGVLNVRLAKQQSCALLSYR